MHTTVRHQIFSFALAALMTLGVLAGIDHQAKTTPTDALLAQVVPMAAPVSDAKA
jgi:hypothetical protein